LSAVFSPDGSRIVTASLDKTSKVWDAETGAEIHTLKGHTGVVSSAVFSPDGSRIVTASSEDKTVKVWDAKNCAEFLTLDGQTFAGWEHRDKTARLMGRLSAQWVSLSADGSRFVAARYDKYDKKVAKVGDARTGAEELSLTGHTDRIISASFSPDGSRIATASVDGRLKVWDPTTGTEFLSLKGHNGVEWAASFSPDGLRIGTSTRDGTAKVWDATPISREFLQTGRAPPTGRLK
jgi:WD40 repeat protein